ncbi:MAG: hypothetical protein IPP82_09370 [Xanthomonadales bacterium]|nr:hypothetical protein [Xanthomonadales bacterium]
MKIMMFKMLLTIFVWSHCSFASDLNLDREVGLILASSYTVGEITSIDEYNIDSNLANYVVSVIGNAGKRNFLLNNPAHEPLPSIYEGKKIILLIEKYFNESGQDEIQWSPSIGIFDAEGYDDVGVEEEIRAAKRVAVAFLNRNAECPRKIESLLSRLDGSHQQEAIDGLFRSLPFKPSEFACIARAIGSKSTLTVGSFRPPYPSREGVYHHGLRTRGELVAVLLPHMTKYPIYLPSSTLDERSRKKMIEAWAYWGSRAYAIGDPIGDAGSGEQGLGQR